MRLLVIAAVLAAPLVRAAPVWAGAELRPGAPSPAALCRAAIAQAERTAGVPDRLMQSIGMVESGRRDETGAMAAYSWTINAAGVGSYYASKAEAIAAVLAFRAQGIRSIYVGCMQVNLMHHADAFASLDEAFDPAANALYAARFLTRLLVQTGSWPAATAGYHSLTPDIGAEYARKVLAVWAKPASRTTPDLLQAAAPASGTSFAAQSAAGGRVIPLPTPGVAAAGRGLASYRAAPTRLAAGLATGRG